MNHSDARTDEALIRAANQGDTSAFEALYYRYRDWVARLAYRITHDRDDSLDVVQEAFAYWAGKFPGFRLTARVTTFLYPVVRSLALARRRKRHPSRANTDLPWDVPDPTSLRPQDATRADLAAVLAVLSAEQREVLLMRFVDDLSQAEIAEALNIPVGTVKSRLHHALQTLRGDERTRAYFTE